MKRCLKPTTGIIHKWFDEVYNKTDILKPCLTISTGITSTPILIPLISVLSAILIHVSPLVGEAAENKKITSDKNLLKLMKSSEDLIPITLMNI